MKLFCTYWKLLAQYWKINDLYKKIFAYIGNYCRFAGK